jgi:DNA-nicking Smr family endonuclease
MSKNNEANLKNFKATANLDRIYGSPNARKRGSLSAVDAQEMKHLTRRIQKNLMGVKSRTIKSRKDSSNQRKKAIIKSQGNSVDKQMKKVLPNLKNTLGTLNSSFMKMNTRFSRNQKRRSDLDRKFGLKSKIDLKKMSQNQAKKKLDKYKLLQNMRIEEISEVPEL